MLITEKFEDREQLKVYLNKRLEIALSLLQGHGIPKEKLERVLEYGRLERKIFIDPPTGDPAFESWTDGEIFGAKMQLDHTRNVFMYEILKDCGVEEDEIYFALSALDDYVNIQKALEVIYFEHEKCKFKAYEVGFGNIYIIIEDSKDKEYYRLIQYFEQSFLKLDNDRCRDEINKLETAIENLTEVEEE